MIIATQKGYTNVVKLLLDAKADPNLEDGNGKTALGYAFTSGNSELVAMITKAGGK